MPKEIYFNVITEGSVDRGPGFVKELTLGDLFTQEELSQPPEQLVRLTFQLTLRQVTENTNGGLAIRSRIVRTPDNDPPKGDPFR